MKFKVGDMVVRKTHPDEMGNVVSTPESNQSDKYQVIIKGEEFWLDEAELETHSGPGLSL